MTNNPSYQPYFLAQRIEELRRNAESTRSNESIVTMTALMRSIECWHSEGGVVKTAYSFVDYVQKNYRTHRIGHLAPLKVESIFEDWFRTEAGASFLVIPSLEADELFLFGWLVVFALHEDYKPLKASVILDPHQEEFVIRGVKRDD